MNIVEITSNQKIKVPYSNIKEIQLLPKKNQNSRDFSIHYQQKGKLLKENYSSIESEILIREIKKKMEILNKNIKKYKGKDEKIEFELFLIPCGYLVIEENKEKKISTFPLELLKKLYFFDVNFF